MEGPDDALVTVRLSQGADLRFGPRNFDNTVYKELFLLDAFASRLVGMKLSWRPPVLEDRSGAAASRIDTCSNQLSYYGDRCLEDGSCLRDVMIEAPMVTSDWKMDTVSFRI